MPWGRRFYPRILALGGGNTLRIFFPRERISGGSSGPVTPGCVGPGGAGHETTQSL